MIARLALAVLLVVLGLARAPQSAPTAQLRATDQPYPTNAPATPGPSPTPPPAYPAPASLAAVVSAPHITARWDSSSSATVSWYQAQRGCLYRQPTEGAPVFVSCYERFPATITITFGHIGPLSGDLRPQAGDVYILQTSGQTYRAPLVARALYFPVWRA